MWHLLANLKINARESVEVSEILKHNDNSAIMKQPRTKQITKNASKMHDIIKIHTTVASASKKDSD